MCGFAGFLGGEYASDASEARAVLQTMAARIAHRGPDSAGIFHDSSAGLALAHNRLAIVDLSEAGHQPMDSAGGRYVISYNGELYNNADLREALAAHGSGVQWRGHSDTETLLAAIEFWGIESALQRTIGMFAFALWDKIDRTLILARDRLGEKPLYYGWQGTGLQRSFLFASELKAIRSHPAFAGEIDRGSLASFMRHNYVPAPRSIYQGIRKLLPGHFAVVRVGDNEPRLVAYWSAAMAVGDGIADPLPVNANECVEAFEFLLKDAVKRQMMADVPLGAFLSGGIDSSAVVALMQAQSSRPVKTFSIGFHEDSFNEAVHAKAVAAHLGTEHTELYVTADQAMSVIPSLPAIYDEPFADSSQIPTYLVSKMAREHVTVSLSGDAGDELFAGYTRYAITDRLWKRLARIPRPARHVAAHAIRALPPSAWGGLVNAGAALWPKIGQISDVGHKVHKGANVMASADAAELYRGLISHWTDPSGLVIGGEEPTDNDWAGITAIPGLSDVERMMATDLVSYLPDDILVKVDRAGMAVSLEGRVPFLDHRVVEFAWRLPLAMKLREGKTKWPLRQVLYRHVPAELIERPKMGFGMPVGAWLRGPLRDWAEALLNEGRLREEGFIDPAPVRQAWSQHLSGGGDNQYHLWDVLMYQAWLENERSEQALRPG